VCASVYVHVDLCGRVGVYVYVCVVVGEVAYKIHWGERGRSPPLLIQPLVLFSNQLIIPLEPDNISHSSQLYVINFSFTLWKG